jgi:hypothetical protein
VALKTQAMGNCTSSISLSTSERRNSTGDLAREWQISRSRSSIKRTIGVKSVRPCRLKSAASADELLASVKKSRMLCSQLSRSSISVRDRIKRARSITVLLALTPHAEVTGLLFSIESLRCYAHPSFFPAKGRAVATIPSCIVNSPSPLLFAPNFLSSR